MQLFFVVLLFAIPVLFARSCCSVQPCPPGEGPGWEYTDDGHPYMPF